MKIVLASANAGKLAELSRLLAPLGFTLSAQSDLGISAAEETGRTFIENALAKARHASEHSGLPAIADDSGLCVDALGGAPGIHSARYAGAGADDDANNRKLIGEIDGLTDLRASYYCALVYLQHGNDPMPILATGRWHGRIVRDPRGSHGFGYDPHFYVPTLDATAAELDADRKNRISHRGQAVRSLIAQLDAERQR